MGGKTTIAPPIYTSDRSAWPGSKTKFFCYVFELIISSLNTANIFKKCKLLYNSGVFKKEQLVYNVNQIEYEHSLIKVE